MNFNLHLWLIPMLPLLGALINGALGRRFSKTTITAVALVSTAASFGIALWVASQFSGLAQVPYVESHGPWIQISGFSVNFAFLLDQLSLVMLLVVTGVGFLIHIYSAGYMADDDGYYRFFAYLNLFMFFMLMLFSITAIGGIIILMRMMLMISIFRGGQDQSIRAPWSG